MPPRSAITSAPRRLTTATIAASALLLLPAILMSQQVPSGFQQAWLQAEALSSQSQYAAAAERYRAILAEFPKSQRAALRVAINEEKAGNVSVALKAYDAALALDPAGAWADVTLFYKAAACSRLGARDDVLSIVEQLTQQFPDSSYSVRALVLQAQAKGESTEQPEALLARELEAAAIYEDARALSKQGKDAEALAKVRDVQARFPESAAALRAQDMEGHLLIRGDRRDKALEVFRALVQKAGAKAPTSLIVDRARTRIAALHHNWQDRTAALAEYRELMKSSDPATAANASLQAAGIEFEILQRDKVRGRPISSEQWDAVRESCTRVTDSRTANLDQRATADLMIVETYSWQGDTEQVLQAGNRFLQKYSAGPLDKQIATVRCLMGYTLFLHSRFEEAIPHYRWVVDAYPEKREFWPNTENLANAHFMLWRALRRTNAPAEEWRAVGEVIKTQFAGSVYASFVRESN